MNARYCSLIIVSLVLFLAIPGCSGNQGNTPSTSGTNGGGVANTAGNTASDPAAKGEYPPAVAEEFVKSCVAAGSDEKFCTCVFEKVQSKYSFEEFSVIESKLSAGTPPDDFVEFSGRARAQCMK